MREREELLLKGKEVKLRGRRGGRKTLQSWSGVESYSKTFLKFTLVCLSTRYTASAHLGLGST